MQWSRGASSSRRTRCRYRTWISRGGEVFRPAFTFSVSNGNGHVQEPHSQYRFLQGIALAAISARYGRHVLVHRVAGRSLRSNAVLWTADDFEGVPDATRDLGGHR